MFKNTLSDETKAVLGLLIIPISLLLLKENWSSFNNKYDKIIFLITFALTLWTSVRAICKVFKSSPKE